MSNFSNSESEDPSDKPASEGGLSSPVRFLYSYLWLNLLFALLLASNLIFPKAADDLDLE